MATTARATPCWPGRIWARSARRKWTRRSASSHRAHRSGRKMAPTVYVGVAEWLKKPETRSPTTTLPTVEVWHWKDVNVISEQKLTAARDRDRNALAAWHCRQRAGDAALHESEGRCAAARSAGARALALDGTPYEVDSDVRARFTDVYKVNLETGARTAGGEASDSAGRFQSRRPLRAEFQGRPFLGLRSRERRHARTSARTRRPDSPTRRTTIR